MLTVQLFDFSKVGAEKAFLHEKAVLEAVTAGQQTGARGTEVLPRLITTSTNIDAASAASIVSQPIASAVSAGMVRLSCMCRMLVYQCCLFR